MTVARVVRPEPREAFERWAEDVLEVASRFPGNLGASLLHPGPGQLRVPPRLPLRGRRVAGRVGALVGAPVGAGARRGHGRRRALPRVSGLESFFTRSPQPGPRWRMTALTIAAVFAITSLLQQFVMPLLRSWPLEARLALSAVLVVLLLGHLVMPTLTRWLSGWLHPRRPS